MRTIMRAWLEPSVRSWPDEQVGPWEVVISWREGVGGAVVCTGLALSLRQGAPVAAVTSTLVRALPVAALIAAARRERFAEAGGHLVEAVAEGQVVDVSAKLLDGLTTASQAWSAVPTGRRRELGPQHFRDVAAEYSKAENTGSPPLMAVEKRWTVSRPTASRWVKEARDLGLLPPTMRGVARGNGPLAAANQASSEGDSR